MLAQKQQVQVRCSRALAVPCIRVPRALQAPRTRGAAVLVRASSSDNPLRQALSGVVSGIFKVTGAMAAPESGLSPLWQSIKRMDLAAVNSAVSTGTDLNERDANGDTALLYIARAGHYKYPPAEIPAALIKGGADVEAKDGKGMTALQVSLLAGWQNIAELLIKAGASTSGVPAIKARLTCPDCKRIVAKYNL